MKKLLMVFLALLCSNSIYATDKHFWRISYPNMMYMFWNDANKSQLFRFYVNKIDEGRTADQVTLLCNGVEMDAIAGDWIECNVNPHKPISFTITDKNFKQGAAGYADIPWLIHAA